METIINVDDVSFSYGTQTEQALKHISLGVNRGDFIGIIGPSGAGKSTLAACLSGAVPHHYTGTFFGSVTVDGNDTCEVSLTDVSQIVGSVLITGGLLLLAYSGYVIWQVVPGLNVSASWAVQGANVSAVVGIAGVAMLAFGLLLALRQITAAPLSRLGLIGAPPAPPKR